MTKQITFGLILYLSCSLSDADYFAAPLGIANWNINRGHSSCHLKHEIPLYGAADFIQQSGELLRFSITEQRFKPEIVKASLSIDTAPWIHQSLTVKDYAVFQDNTTNSHNYPQLSVYGEAAEIMLDALSKGQYPTFTYVRAAVGGLSLETNVAVSSINFAKNYEQFIDCRKGFLPAGFKTVLEKSLFFKAGSQQLSASTLKQLRDAARYINEVKGSKVVIVSETAIAGSKDKKWFTKRANIISNQLKKMGLPENKLRISHRGYASSANSKIIQLSVFGPDALKAIYYRKGNTQLNATEKQRLDLLVRYVEEFIPNSQLLIKSHTDSKGKRATNLKISQVRGDEIKRYLVSQGLDEKQVQVKAYGESKPAKNNRFPTGRAQNRRIFIDLLG